MLVFCEYGVPLNLLLIFIWFPSSVSILSHSYKSFLKNPSLDVDDGKLMDVPCSNFLDLEILYSDDYVDVICNWHTLNNVFVTSC